MQPRVLRLPDRFPGKSSGQGCSGHQGVRLTPPLHISRVRDGKNLARWLAKLVQLSAKGSSMVQAPKPAMPGEQAGMVVGKGKLFFSLTIWPVGEPSYE